MTPDLVLHEQGEYLTPSALTYEWAKGELMFRLIVFPGFNTDIASVPKGAGLLGFKTDGPHRRAAIFHDWLYYWKGRIPEGSYKAMINGEWVNVIARWTRKEADQLFYKIMLEDGTPKWKAWTMYQAVRLAGGIHSRDVFW